MKSSTRLGLLAAAWRWRLAARTMAWVMPQPASLRGSRTTWHWRTTLPTVATSAMAGTKDRAPGEAVKS